MKLYTEEQMKELMYWTMKMTVGCVHSRIDDCLENLKIIVLAKEFAHV